MEDGEIPSSDLYLGDRYDPALEWPGEDHLVEPSDILAQPGPSSQELYYGHEVTNARKTGSQGACCLRLLVSHSNVLSKSQRIAILDGYAEVQIGRDAAPLGHDTPRIRLKEMEVSKVHATVYWDHDRAEWAVVDMGSKHGTFLQSTSTAGAPAAIPSSSSTDSRGMRLSPSRIASVPARIKHGDKVSCGSTTFVVHSHESGLPCVECSPTGGDEIALFSALKSLPSESNKKRKRAELQGGPSARTAIDKNPKNAIMSLKRNLLSHHASSPSDSAHTPRGGYVDRSARRRALQGHPLLGSPLTHSSSPPTPVLLAPQQTPVSAVPVPIPTNNVGHQLLMKQGWQPGSHLGVSEGDASRSEDRVALTEPIDIAGNKGRAGLGMSLTSQMTLDSGVSWKDEAKLRRYSALKEGHG